MTIEITQLALMVGTFLAEKALGTVMDTVLDGVWSRLLDTFRTKFPNSQHLLGDLQKDPKDGKHKAALIDSLSKQISTDEGFRQQVEEMVAELLRCGWKLPALPPPTALHQLPADIPDFTGREQEMAGIVKEVDKEHTSSIIIVVTGLGGTGKSALAVHAAHVLKERFPSTQLYVDLRGADAQPASPLNVLASFLRALGVEETDIPKDLDELEVKYRSVLANRRALVLLDNARDETQVRSLIPGGAGCLVLITSRWSLGALESAGLRLELSTLLDEDALALLARCGGQERVIREPDAAERIVRLCGNLPLAVRIAGGHLRTRAVTLWEYADSLEDENGRLAALQAGDKAVRASFMLSYQSLSPWEARLFRLIGLLRGESFSPKAALALDGGEEKHVWNVLEHLVDAQLIGLKGTRYGIHDLVHLLAKECLAQEKAEEQDAARTRLAGWLADESRAMSAWLSSDTRAQTLKELARDGVRVEGRGRNEMLNALNWFELERGNLLAAVEHAHRSAQWELTWQLAINSAVFYNLRSHWADWERTHVLALDAARRKPDEGAEGVVLNLLGNVYRHQGRWGEAAVIFQQSLELNRRLGNIKGESIALNLLANVYRLQGRWEEALALFKEGLELNTRHDNPLGRAIALGGLGNVYRMQGRWEEALRVYEASLQLADEQDDRHGRSINLNVKGQVLVRLGRIKEAEAALNESLELCRELKSPKGECIARRILGEVFMARQDWERAFENLTSSLRIARQYRDKRCTSQTLIVLGEWHTERGNRDEAEACLEEARSILHTMDDRHDDGLALRSLGRLRFVQGRQEQALSVWQEALALLNPLSPEAAEVKEWLERPARVMK